MKYQLIYLFFIGLIGCNESVDKQKEAPVNKDTITKEWFYSQFQKDTLSSICLDSKIINKLFFIGNKRLNLDTGRYAIKKEKFKPNEDLYILNKTNRFKMHYESIFCELRTFSNSLELIHYNYDCQTDSFNSTYQNRACDYYFKNDSIRKVVYDEHVGDMYFPYKNFEAFKKYMNDYNKGVIVK
jgi:hypothetical protein